MSSISFTTATWNTLLAQPTLIGRAQAFAGRGIASFDILALDGSLIRTITTGSWTVSAQTAGGGYMVSPGSYTDSATGSGIPAVAVFRNGSGTEIFRCDAGIATDPVFYLFADEIKAGVPIERGEFGVLFLPREATEDPPADGSLSFLVPSSIVIEQGGTYDLSRFVHGGTPPYKDFVVASGTLPDGVTLATETGVLSATSEAALETQSGLSFQASDSEPEDEDPPPPPPPDPDEPLPEVNDGEFPQYFVDDSGRGPNRMMWNRELHQFWPSFVETNRNAVLYGGSPSYNGDWTNTEGERSFTLPYASVFFPGGTLGWIELDITDLARRWITDNKGAFLRSPSTGRLYFDGRLGENPPELVVTHPGGEITFKPGYASHFFTSSSSSNVTTIEARVTSQSRTLLHWRDIEIPEDMTAAKIRLFVRESNPTTGCRVEVYETNIPLMRIGAGGQEPTLGLAAEVGETNLPTHPDVFVAGECTPENLFGIRPTTGDWGSSASAPAPLSTRALLARSIKDFDYSFEIESDGRTSLRASFVHGTGRIADTASFGAHYNHVRADESDPAFPIKPEDVIEEMYARCYFMLEEDFWTTTDGIKFGMGFDMTRGVWMTNQGGYWEFSAGGGSGQAKASGKKEMGASKWIYSGCSVRQHMLQCRPTGTLFNNYRPLVAAPSHLGPYFTGTGIYGSEETILFPGVVFELGKWYCVEAHIKLNSIVGPFDDVGNGVAVNDGILEYYIDGVLSGRRTHFAWRRHPEISIAGYWFATLHGGTVPAAPGEVMHYRVKDIAVAKRYIGPKP